MVSHAVSGRRFGEAGGGGSTRRPAKEQSGLRAGCSAPEGSQAAQLVNGARLQHGKERVAVLRISIVQNVLHFSEGI